MHETRKGLGTAQVGFLLSLGLLAGSCARSSPGDAPGAEANVAVVSGSLPQGARFVADRLLVTSVEEGNLRLRSPASGALTGWVAPVAVPSPDGRYLAYSTWDDYTPSQPGESPLQQGLGPTELVGKPSLRILSLDDGRDVLFEDGAYSIAWAADGRLAYFKGSAPDFVPGQPYVGSVLIRGSLDSAPEVWSAEEATYIVAAWAGSDLLVYRKLEGEQLDLYVFSGPGDVRLLGMNTHLIAVSPDGTRVMVSQPQSPVPSVTLVEVATGEEIARLPLDRTEPVTGREVGWVSYAGSWAGNRVVAEAGPGLVVFNVSGNSLSIDQVLAIPSAVFPSGVHEPLFTDDSATRVAAWGHTRSQGEAAHGRLYRTLDCDVPAMECTAGPPQESKGFFQAVNPSRPQGEA